MHDKSILAEQFDDIEQQHSTGTFGMWIFLATEIMFFGGLFAAYVVYRYLYPEAFSIGSHHVETLIGGVNTAILLTSSFTMALGVQAAHTGKGCALTRYLVVTALLGVLFLVVKLWGWHTDFYEGLVPGRYFTMTGPEARHTEMFFVLYYTMTGLHGLHVLIGVGMLLILAYLSRNRHRYVGEAYAPIEIAGLYWHFVDLVWIFLFPLFYLIGAR